MPRQLTPPVGIGWTVAVGGDPVGEAAKSRLEQEISTALRRQGATDAEIQQITDPAKRAAVSFEPAGTALHAEYQAKLTAANGWLVI